MAGEGRPGILGITPALPDLQVRTGAGSAPQLYRGTPTIFAHPANTDGRAGHYSSPGGSAVAKVDEVSGS